MRMGELKEEFPRSYYGKDPRRRFKSVPLFLIRNAVALFSITPLASGAKLVIASFY